MTKMTHKIPIIENIGTKAEHLTTVTKVKADGDFPFDDLLKPGLIAPLHLKTSDKIKQLNLFQNQNRTEDGKRTPLKTKPILDTSTLRQKAGEETQTAEPTGVSESVAKPSETKVIEAKNTQRKEIHIPEIEGERSGVKDAQPLETEDKQASLTDTQILGTRARDTEVTPSKTEKPKDSNIEDVDQVQVISNSPELTSMDYQNQQPPINPIDLPIEENLIISNSPAVKSQSNPNKPQVELNVSRRNPLLDLTYPMRHTDSSSMGKNTAVKAENYFQGNADKLATLSSSSTLSKFNDYEKIVGRPVSAVSPPANNQNHVDNNGRTHGSKVSKNNDRVQPSPSMSTLAKTIVASVSSENSKQAAETVKMPQNREIGVVAKPPMILLTKSGESAAPQGLKIAGQSQQPLNPVKMPEQDGKRMPASVENEAKIQNSQKGSGSWTNSAPIALKHHQQDSPKEIRPVQQVVAPVQGMAKQNHGVNEDYTAEAKKSIPSERVSNNVQLRELEAKQESTFKKVDDASIPRIKQAGQKTSDRNPIVIEAKTNFDPAIKHRGDEAKKPDIPVVSSERLKQEIQVQGEKITSIANDSVNPGSSEKLIPDASITSSISSMIPDKPATRLQVKSKETRRANPVSPTQHLRTKRSEHMQQSYGVEAPRQRLVLDSGENPADILKEQLRDRIEFLKKTQSSIHLDQDQNPNLHRNQLMKSVPESGMVQHQSSVLAHPRVNAPLFARSFAGEMVEKIRDLTDKMGPTSSSQKPTFTVNGGVFGQLDIEFDLEKSSEQITIYVEDELSKTELQRVLPNIEDNLLQRGYNFTGLEVEVRNQHKDSEAMTQGKQNNSHQTEEETAPLPQGENEDKKTNTNRNYGYNTMEVLA